MLTNSKTPVTHLQCGRPPRSCGISGLQSVSQSTFEPVHDPQRSLTLLQLIDRLDDKQVRELDGSEKAPDLLEELFVEGTNQLVDCLPDVWDDTLE